MLETPIVVIWRFEVRPAALERFAALYGPDGPWIALFRRGSGYRGTELLVRQDEPGTFVTIDRWSSLERYDDFRREHAAALEALDEEGAALTEHEERLGIFVEPRR